MRVNFFDTLDILLYSATIPVGGAATAIPAYLAILLAGEMAYATQIYGNNPDDLSCFWGGFMFGLAGVMTVAGVITGGAAIGLIIGFITWILPGVFIPTATAMQCKAFPWN